MHKLGFLSRILQLTTAGAALVLAAAHAQEPETTLKLPPRIMPLSPTELLALMPAPPKEWKVTASTAMTQPGAWLRTIATRKMEFTPPPASPEPGKPPAPPVVYHTTITLIDTGYDHTSDGEFEDFKPSTAGNVAKVAERAGPTVRIQLPGGKEMISVFIKQRFIYRVELENQPPNADKGWEAQLGPERLTAVPDSGSHTLPAKIELAFVDELHPARSRKSYQYLPAADPSATPAR